MAITAAMLGPTWIVSEMFPTTPSDEEEDAELEPRRDESCAAAMEK